MTLRRRVCALLLVGFAALALPSAAAAHAYLIKTFPVASGVLNSPPGQVSLTYDEAVEPKFAIVSVTDASGHQQTAAPVRRSPANPDTLVVPLHRNLPQGWYLVYWRAISVDGHPVQGAFTYAVGPNPGPAPQFPIPHLSATATTPQLLIARWAALLFVMSAIGLFVLRTLIARSAVRRVPGTSLRALTRAFVITSVLGLIAIPVYLDIAIANDSLRSVFDLGCAGSVVPGYRIRPRLPGHGAVLRPVLARRLDLAVARSPRSAAALGGRTCGRDRRPAGRGGHAGPPGGGRPRRADLAARSLGRPGCRPSRPPARCGWAA